MKLLPAIFLLIFLASCSSWSGQPTTSKASMLTGTELERVRLIFKNDSIPSKISIHVLKSADKTNYDLVSSVDTNNNILQIVFPGQNKNLTTEITVSNSVGNYIYAGKLGDTILYEQVPDFWLIAWFNEPFYKNEIAGDLNKNHKYELHIIAIEKSSGKKIADEILYTTNCCIDRLDMKYNPYNKSVLYAFNDYGGKDYKVLYGYISVRNNKIIFTKPYPLIFKDETEKRQPSFVDNKKSIYLYHTTGDSWGFGGHIGKQQIGIFLVDSLNRPIKYKIINDKFKINDKIVFIRDTIYYRLEDANEYDKMTIKKIAWEDLKEN